MTTNGSQNNRVSQRNVFRRRTSRSHPIWRLLVESIVLLSAGSGILYFLNLLPEKFDGVVFLRQGISDLIEGTMQLLNAFINLGSLILIGLLVLLGLLLLLGGVWRFIRFITKLLHKILKSPSTRNNKSLSD